MSTIPFVHQYNELAPYLPTNAIAFVNELLQSYHIKFSLTKPRRSLLGYYKAPQPTKKQTTYHTITINNDLNPYLFFFVLLHEIAHLKTYLLFGSKIKPHGTQWQNVFTLLLKESLQHVDFPPIIKPAIQQLIQNPASLRSCTNIHLLRIFTQFDSPQTKAGRTFVEQIPIGGSFEDARGRKLRIIEKKRTRFLCKELQSQQLYYYPALLEVIPSKDT